MTQHNTISDNHAEESHGLACDKALSTVTVSQSRLDTPSKDPTFGKALFLICGIISFGLSFGTPTSLSVYFLEWQSSFQENRASTATIHASCAGTLNTAAVIPGLLMSRYGDRVTLLLGCVLASSGLIVSMFATNVAFMVATTGVLFGLGCCMINLPTIPCVMSVFNTNQSIYIAIVCIGAAIANTVLPFFYTFLSSEYGWRGSHLIIGGLILQACVSSLVLTSYFPTTPRKEREEKLLENGKDHDETNVFTDKQLTFPKAGFLLQGVSITSLHSSTFGSQILGSMSRTNTKDSCQLTKDLSKHDIHPPLNVHSNESVNDEERGHYRTIQSRHSFLFDVLYLVEVMASSFCLSALYSTVALMMDFTKSKGFTDNSVSVFLVSVAFLSSMVGKIFTGLINLIPSVHSLHYLCIYGYLSCGSLLMLNYMSSYYALCVAFSVVGFVLGGILAVYPKCILDMSTVDIKSYPIALGINNSLIGIFDLGLPIIMGYTVDRSQTYTLAIFIYSAVCLCLSVVLTFTFYVKDRQAFLFCSKRQIK